MAEVEDPKAAATPEQAIVARGAVSTLPIEFDPRNFDDMFRMARILSKANMLPDYLRGKDADCVITMMMGRELGVSPGVALREIYVVKGKPFVSAKLRLALVQQSPVCQWIRCTHSDTKKATWETLRKGDSKPIASSFTIDEAMAAGLVRDGSAWKTYPANMLRWRALGFLLDMVYPELLTGFGDREVDLDEEKLRNPDAFLERADAPRAPPVVAKVKVETPPTDAEVVGAAMGKPTQVDLLSEPMPPGPDEFAADLIRQMAAAPDLAAMKEIGAKSKGLPGGLEEDVLRAFQARKAELAKKKGDA